MYNAKTEQTIKNIKTNLLNAEIAINQKCLLADDETKNILSNYKDYIRHSVETLIKSISEIAEKCDDEFKLDTDLDKVSAASLQLSNSIIDKVNSFESKTEEELEIESIKESVRNMFEDNNGDYDYIMNCVKEVGESLVSTVENKLASNKDGVDTKDLVYDIAEKSLSALREKLENK